MDASARDPAALHGSWEQVAFEKNGVVDDPIDRRARCIDTFGGDRFSVCTLQGELLLEGRVTLDGSSTPAAITWIDAKSPDAGKPLPASYCLDGDDFVFSR